MMRDYPTPPRSAAERDAREVRDRHDDDRLAKQELARRLGHTEIGVMDTASGRRFFAYCSCGYASTTRATQRLAVEAAMAHIDSSIRAWHQSGLPLPSEPGPRPVPWAEMARKFRHVEQWLAATRSPDRMVS